MEELLPSTSFTQSVEQPWKQIWRKSCQPGQCLEQHWEALSGDIEVCSLLHYRNHFCNDGIVDAGHSSPETDDGDHTCGVSLKVRNILFRCSKQLVRYDSTLIVLEVPILSYLLKADTHVCDLAVDSPSIAIKHGHQIRLTHPR